VEGDAGGSACAAVVDLVVGGNVRYSFRYCGRAVRETKSGRRRRKEGTKELPAPLEEPFPISFVSKGPGKKSLPRERIKAPRVAANKGRIVNSVRVVASKLRFLILFSARRYNVEDHQPSRGSCFIAHDDKSLISYSRVLYCSGYRDKSIVSRENYRVATDVKLFFSFSSRA
jgi:hypothetical protein